VYPAYRNLLIFVVVFASAGPLLPVFSYWVLGFTAASDGSDLLAISLIWTVILAIRKTFLRWHVSFYASFTPWTDQWAGRFLVGDVTRNNELDGDNCVARRFINAFVLACVGVLVPGLWVPVVNAQQADANQVANVEDSRLDASIGSSRPPSGAGECYAQVRVPPVYRVEPVDVVVREASSRFDIAAARFESRTRRVITQDAATKLTPIQPRIVVEPRELELAPVTTRWVRDNLQGSIPLSDGDQRDLEHAGIEYQAMPTGSCLYEHYMPAKVTKVPHQLLLRESYQVLGVTPATFASHTEVVTTKPKYDRLIEVPTVFRKVETQVLTKAASAIWEPGPGPQQIVDAVTGETQHQVNRPAEYESMEKVVVETPAMLTSVAHAPQQREIRVKRLQNDAQEQVTVVPATFETVHKPRIDAIGAYAWSSRATNNGAELGEPTGRVFCHRTIPAKVHRYQRALVKTQGRFEREALPEQYEDVDVSELTAAAHGDEIAVPAETKRVDRRTELRGARTEWHPVLCKSNITRSVVTRLQKALLREGFSPGPIDGLLGRGTLGAVKRFQKDADLAEGGLTLDTITALGLDL